MKKNKKLIRENYKLVMAFILVITLLGTVGVYAATYINAINVPYNNSTSGLSATNMQDALDVVHSKNKLKNRKNIVEAHTYNASSCVTGEESTCVRTTCYESTTAGSCPAGTIIRYKVNDSTIVTFHVMYDNGTTMTMQSQKNTIYNTPWISAADYATENTDSTTCGYEACNDEGPITVLEALESATAGWTNVNSQTYTMGTTTFKTNAYTGCSSNSDGCETNTYTLNSRTAKARMITLQEANNLGCGGYYESCPNWMNNYLYNSTSYGGTVSDSTKDPTTGKGNYGYWTMNAYSSNVNLTFVAWSVTYNGDVDWYNTCSDGVGARAVVVVSK